MNDPAWLNGKPSSILLATDLSARCDRALDRAAALAGEWQARLVAVHAIEAAPDMLDGEDAVVAHDLVEAQIRRDLQHQLPDIGVVVQVGRPEKIVLQTARAEQSGLIVTGIARDELLGRFGLGNSVDSLLRGARTPVLIVKQRPAGPYGDILVASDFSESSAHALRLALAWFPDRRLTLFHAFEPPPRGLADTTPADIAAQRAVLQAEAAAFLDRSGLSDAQQRGLNLLIEPGQPAELIASHVLDRGVELVILGSHGRSAVLDILLGSTAKDILSDLACDALLVREPRAAVAAD